MLVILYNSYVSKLFFNNRNICFMTAQTFYFPFLSRALSTVLKFPSKISSLLLFHTLIFFYFYFLFSILLLSSTEKSFTGSNLYGWFVNLLNYIQIYKSNLHLLLSRYLHFHKKIYISLLRDTFTTLLRREWKVFEK